MKLTPRITELSYVEDSARRFDRLAARPWSMLLDSGFPRSKHGRFDVMVSDPYLTLTTRGMETEIAGATGIKIVTDDPFTLLKRYTREHQLDAHPYLPFLGGAVGCFAYDLGRRVETLPDLAAHDIDMPDMAVGFYRRCAVTDHRARKSYLITTDGDAKAEQEWRHLLEVVEPTSPVAFRPAFQVLSQVKANMTREEYARRFNKIKKYLLEGDCYQVNLAQRFSARKEGDAWDAYKYLRQLNPAPFSAFIRLPEGEILSSSPERFLKVHHRSVETKPIKGTRPRSADAAHDTRMAAELSASLKDRAENLMIVDLLRNDLGKTCETGSVRVPKLFAIESFATVHHLVSTITGTLSADRHPADLLRGCFPGGSITGAPKRRAMEIIEELEPHRRSIYCGAIGYLGFDGNMDTNIAIRTLVCHQNVMHAWAGGGIVMDSSLEDEYQESLDKAAAMLKLFMRTESMQIGG